MAMEGKWFLNIMSKALIIIAGTIGVGFFLRIPGGMGWFAFSAVVAALLLILVSCLFRVLYFADFLELRTKFGGLA
jgi:hypothetical protein